MKNYIKQVLEDSGRICSEDNRTNSVKSINKLLESDNFKISICTHGYAFCDGEFKHNIRIKFLPTGTLLKIYHKKFITPDFLIRKFHTLLKEKNIKSYLSTQKQTKNFHNCSKCEGTGVIPAFAYYCDGICFDCMGIGIIFTTNK